MGTERRGGDREDEKLSTARAAREDRELEAVLDRMGDLCRILAEEIVLFDYLNERRARTALDEQGNPIA